MKRAELVRAPLSFSPALYSLPPLFFLVPPAPSPLFALGAPMFSDVLRGGLKPFGLPGLSRDPRNHGRSSREKSGVSSSPFLNCRCPSRSLELQDMQTENSTQGLQVKEHDKTSQNCCRLDRRAVSSSPASEEVAGGAEVGPTANEQRLCGTGAAPRCSIERKKGRLEMMNIRHLAERGDEVVDVLLRRHEPEDLVAAARELTGKEELCRRKKECLVGGLPRALFPCADPQGATGQDEDRGLKLYKRGTFLQSLLTLFSPNIDEFGNGRRLFMSSGQPCVGGRSARRYT